MSQASSGFDLVDDLVEAFLERYRRGERPSLTEYTDQHPELADRIRALFPALLVIEELGSGGGQATGLVVDRTGSERDPLPRRLGDYLLLRRVGSGGMGIVYEAIQESLGRHVALKTLPTHQLGDATRLERFRREARAAARLQHTHIVPVYGIGEHDGLHYYTMQFIRGHGLDAVLQQVKQLRRDPSPIEGSEAPDGQISTISLACGLRTGRYLANKAESGRTGSPSTGPPRTDPGRAPELAARTSLLAESNDRSGLSDQSEARYVRSVAQIGAHVAEALEYAHQQGILHRDIKPANLLLDAQGQIWITDFGLAKAQDSDELTRTGDVVGTLRYMAPERFNGWSDPRSDVYALGATLYELLTLRPAFGASDRIKLIQQVLHQGPPPPRQLDPRIPRDMETIVLKAMAREPGERYPTARQMADDLRRFVAGQPILARRSGSIERLWRWGRRNPMLAGATAAVVIALLAVVTISLLYAREQSRANLENRTLAQRLSRSLAESNRLLAIRSFDRGQAAFEKDEIGNGLLWMIESWRSAIAAGDRDWQYVARANLAAWQPHHARIKAVFSHDGPVDAAAFSPDGTRVVTGSDDRTARLWDSATGQPVGLPLHHPAQVAAVAYSPDGKTVLTGCVDGIARLWDVDTGRLVRSTPSQEGAVMAVAYSPDGTTILTGGNFQAAHLRDTATFSRIGRPSIPHDFVRAAAFSPDGKTILTGTEGRSARLWDAATGKPVGPALPLQSSIYAVAYHPDGRTVLTGGVEGMVRSWDAARGLPVGQPLRHRFKVRAVAVSPDGRAVLTGSEDKMARIWNTATGRLIGRPLVHRGPVVAVAFGPDGRSFLTASSDHTVRLWDSDLGRPCGLIAEHKDMGHSVAYSPDGRSILTGDYIGRAKHAYAMTGAIIGQTIRHQARIIAVAFSPDGSTLLTGSYDGTAQLWDSTTGNPLGPVLPHEGRVSVVAYSPDGKTIMTGGDERLVRLWDASTGTPLGQPIPQSGTVDAGAFSPDGKSFVIGCDSGSAQLWDLSTRTAVGLPFPHPGCVSATAFSPDGKALLTGCEDGAARLWDVESRRLRTAPLLHRAWIWAVAFSPEGKVILTGSRDQTARLWDSATAMPLGPPIPHPNEILGLAFSPDGREFATASFDYTARIFRRAPELPDDLERRRRLGRGPHRADARGRPGHGTGARQRDLAGKTRGSQASGRSARSRARLERFAPAAARPRVRLGGKHPVHSRKHPEMRSSRFHTRPAAGGTARRWPRSRRRSPPSPGPR